MALTMEQSDLLRQNGRFPDDFTYLETKDGKTKFRNKSEGFVIELDNSKEEIR